MKKYSITALLFLVANIVVFGQTVTVSGNIESWCGVKVEGVTVIATDSDGDATVAISDANGDYILELEEGESFIIAPYSNDGPLNGVSAFDFILIERHLLGVDTITNPFGLIAADINNSGFISAMDILDIRSALLGITPGIPNNTSWRFFHDMMESHTVVNLTDDIFDLDWVAVKIGDLNCSHTGYTNPDPTYLSVISGHVFKDDNGDCLADAGESSLENWDVVATSSTNSFISRTQADGTYQMLVPANTYDIELFPPNELWSTCTPTYEDVEITFPSVSTYDFGAEALVDCPWMTVNLGTVFLRRCFSNAYYVSYCNEGTADAIGAEIVIEFDEYFENFSSSIPWSAVNGNTFTFPIGDVAVGDCGSFSVQFDISCDAELEQTHCSTAHVYPDSICIPTSPLWSGADLDVSGECVGDEIIFTLTNNGDDMTESVEFVVIEDVMIQMTAQTGVLLSGQSEQIPMPAPVANGATWRVMVNESAGHPFDMMNTVAIEGCGGFTPGFVTQFPEGDEEYYVDVDCRENIGSWDPNDKKGFPIGVHDEHFIEEGQDIEYLIRFQNTGTDTAFTVAIYDTLEANLDWTSVELGASSHDFRYNMYGEGVMVFLFDDIMLPDSNVNESASHGFVKFTVKQRAGLDIGMTIENRAAIYFDYNEAVITNRTLHTIGEDYMEISSTETFVQNISLDVFPNPFESSATFRLDGGDWQNGTLILYDQMGRVVSSQNFTGSEFQFDGSILPKGLYFFKIKSGGVDIAAGKLMK